MKPQVVVSFTLRPDGSRAITGIYVRGAGEVEVEVHANVVEDRVTIEGDVATLELIGGVDWRQLP